MFLNVVREFVNLLVLVLPSFAGGAVAGAALQSFLSERWAAWIFGGRGFQSLLSAVSAGALLPGCSCATMPMASGLRGTAAPRLGTISAFIFVSPLLSPMTIALTWGVVGWKMSLARTVASLLGSIILGLIINRLESWFTDGTLLRNGSSATAVTCDPVCGSDADACGPVTVQPRFGSALWAILRSITPYFLLGMLIAAVLSAVLPEDTIPKVLGGSAGIPAYLLATVIGIPLYVCEGEEVPITYALLQQGLAPGPALTFLLGSVGTCIPTMLMAQGIIGRRATVVYLIYWFAFAIGSGFLFQLWIGI